MAGGWGRFCYRLITDEQCLQVTQPGRPPDFMFPFLLGVTQTLVMFMAVFTAPEAETTLLQVTGMDACMDVTVRLWGLEAS